MKENEFRARYAAAQKRVQASPELKMRAVENALREAAHPQAPKSSTLPTRRRGRPSAVSNGTAFLVRRWALPAAACLVAGALVVAGVPALTSSLSSSPAIALDEAAERCGFSVRAYASDGALFELGSDGTVVFDRAEPLYGIGDDYAMAGFFTGCLFRVEGEGIARVQMNVTGGKLYRYAIESFKQGDEPERMKELITRKPLNRGLGTYYGAYDEAIVLPFAVDVDVKNNPDAVVNVGLSKLYGSTVDVSAAEDPDVTAGKASFGLWTNEGDPATLSETGDPCTAIIDQFEGEKLTVTITFEDGHASTQVIELHAADFRRDEGGPTDSGFGRLVPEIVDPAALGEGEHAVRSLYGTVVQADKEPFPLPLDNANELADTVLPAATLDRAPETRPLQASANGELHDMTAAEVEIRDAGTTASVRYRVPDEQDGDGLELIAGPLSVTRSATPPNGKMPEEFTETVYGWLGNLPYFNKCTQERYGYAFNDDGTLTDEGYCYLEAAIEVTNPSDEPAELSLRTLGAFGLVDGDGRLLEIETSYFTLDAGATGDVTLDPGNPREAVIAPGGTARLTLLHVLPNRLADEDGLLFLAGSDGNGAPIAFAVGGQV